MTRSRTAILASVFVVFTLSLLALFALPATAQAALIQCVSLNDADEQANSRSESASISADGRYVAFMSMASNLVVGDVNGAADVFVRDVVTGATTRVSMSDTEFEGNGESLHPSISGDGRYVAFESVASNLVQGDTNGKRDIFVRDLVEGKTVRVSLNDADGEGNGDCYLPSISADGRYVAFESDATDLVSDDTNGKRDIFVRDLVAGTTVRASLTDGGIQGNGDSFHSSISADGTLVAFESDATDLVSADGNGTRDIFVRDLVAGTTTRVSVSTEGIQGNADSGYPSISAEGRYVAFESVSNNLVPNDHNGEWDIFVRDRESGSTSIASLTDAEAWANNSSERPSISGDGRYVAFVSWATNLIIGDTNGYLDVFVRDLVADTTTRMSVAADGTQGNNASNFPSISADGCYVAFDSHASTLVPADLNGAQDIFAAATPPVIFGLAPDFGPTAGHENCVIIGKGFTAVTAVTFGGVDALDFTVDSSQQITATTPPHSPGTVQVRVTAAGGESADTADDDYRYPVSYTSIRGSDRYDTAIKISKATFPLGLPLGAGLVVAPGETFQEALCGAPLAAAYGGPVLLTYKTALANNVKAELIRLDPATVFCIGLSSAAVSAVKAALPGVTVQSLSSSLATVYDMSRTVANALEKKVGDMTGAVALVTIGTNFPDAIALSPLACAKLWPVILTDRADNSVLHTSAQKALADLGTTQALKIGTYATLPGGVTGLTNLSGADRYYTNANVATWAKANAGLTFANVGVATGDKFPDALAAGPYLAKHGGTLLLSPLNGPLPAPIASVLTANAAAVQRLTFIACIEPVISQVKALLP